MKRAGGRPGLSFVAGSLPPRIAVAAFIISRSGRRCRFCVSVLPTSHSVAYAYFGKNGRGIMSRVGLNAAVAAVVGVALTGCSSALSSSSSSEQLQALNFESEPPGAVIRTTEGQTCVTPCELKVPSHEQPVSVSKDDYVAQTVQVAMGPQPDHSFWQNPPPTLVPNPVRVVLQPAPKPDHHAKGRKSASKTHTAKVAPAAHAGRAAPAARTAPAAPSAQSGALPPPPPADPAASPLAPTSK
jgi:hypothetical protein